MSGSIAATTGNSEYIKLDPRKEASDRLCSGRMWKIAALATLVAYTVLAIAATIAVGIYAPIYLPVILAGAIILADFFYNQVYTPLDNKSKLNYAFSKINQGITDELDKLDDKKDFLQARINFYTKYADKCLDKIAKYKKEASEEGSSRSLISIGKWYDKSLRAKTLAAYCSALKEDAAAIEPTFGNAQIAQRLYQKKFLGQTDCLLLANGVTLSDKELEAISIENLKDMILGKPVDVEAAV